MAPPVASPVAPTAPRQQHGAPKMTTFSGGRQTATPPSRTSSRSVPAAAAAMMLSPLPPLPLSHNPIALLNTIQDVRSNGGKEGGGGGAANNAPVPFDPIAFLNKHYGTEQSLAQQLPALREAVHARINVLNANISDAMQRQSETAERTRSAVQSAKTSVMELERRVLQVKEKAGNSESAVLAITKDMKRLDCAKQQLQKTIAALKRLHLLVQAVEQLRLTALTAAAAAPAELRPTSSTGDNCYKTASHLVLAIAQLHEHFQAYEEKVVQIKQLSGKVRSYKEQLRTSLVTLYRVTAFGPRAAKLLDDGKKSSAAPKTTPAAVHDNGDDDDLDEAAEETKNNTTTMIMMEGSKIDAELLQGGTLYIDALGDTYRQRFIHDFCQDLLGEYLKKFEPPDRKPTEKRVSSFKPVLAEPENVQAGLDHIDKRLAWFQEVPLKIIKDRFPNVFPAHWNLQASLANMFLQLTRDHILALLDGPRKDPDAENATILLKALQRTIVFENEITSWLERQCGAVFEKSSSPDAVATSSLATAEKPGGVGPGDVVAAAAANKKLMPLVGVASVAYQNYMGPYIRLEEASMNEKIAEALEDKTVDTRGERPVFISSTKLFVYIKGSITRCTALTKGNSFYLLYNTFRDALNNYCQVLDSKLPAPIQQGGPANMGGIVIGPFTAGPKQPQDSPATSASYKIPPGEEVTVCHVISTCEYCADTMEALEELIRDTIDAEYEARIDMMSDQERFHETTAKSIRILVSGLSNRLAEAIKTMGSMKWETWSAVGEESGYVLTLHEEIKPFVQTVRKLLPTSYFRSFCDKFALMFSSQYYDALLKLKRISEPGTQQLQLDLYNLKSLFLKLPVLEESSATTGKKTVTTGASIAPAMYTKTVQKHFGRMETILKLVGTPNDLLCQNIKVQWPEATTADFQIVMNLKGLKRPDQVSMLEKFGHDPLSALKGATAGITSSSIVSERVQQLQDQGSTVAAKMNSDLSQMRQKVDDFRKNFR